MYRRALLGSALAALLGAAGPVRADPLETQSADGRWRLVADNAARELRAYRADGTLARRMPVADRAGRPSRVARLLDAAPRASFVALLADVPEAWELLYDPRAGPVYEGLVHDHRLGEGIAATGPLPVRRIELAQPLIDALFSSDCAQFVAVAAPGVLHVVDLNVRRHIETVRHDGELRAAAGAAWTWRGGAAFALPRQDAPRIELLDARRWQMVEPLALPQVAARLMVGADGRLLAQLADGNEAAFAPR